MERETHTVGAWLKAGSLSLCLASTREWSSSSPCFQAQIAELHRSQAANQKLTMDIAQENKKLAEPLAVRCPLAVLSPAPVYRGAALDAVALLAWRAQSCRCVYLPRV